MKTTIDNSRWSRCLPDFLREIENATLAATEPEKKVLSIDDFIVGIEQEYVAPEKRTIDPDDQIDDFLFDKGPDNTS
jgi:hypothetical protein